MSRQITKAEYSGKQTEGLFLRDYRELAAFYSGVTEGIVAYLQLNNVEELIALSQAPNPRLYRRLLAEALVTLIDRGALAAVADLNDLAEAELANLRRETGIGVETLPSPPPKPPTAQELLEAEVIADYNGGLPATKMREKRNSNKTYNETFVRLAEGNRLESRVTSNVRAGA
jgi:hypothetical protein